MQRKRIICLILFVVLNLVFSSCHPRHVSDIKPTMTKEEVVSLWGRTALVTHKATDGTTLETWEYHFAASGTICRVTFNQDRVTDTPQCDRSPVGRWYYAQSEGPPYPERYYDPYPYLSYYPFPFFYGGSYDYYRPDHYPHRYPYHQHRHRR